MNNFLTQPNKSPVSDFHAIVTDHPRMRELGLGVFTTGDLNTWLHKLKPGRIPVAGPANTDFINWSSISFSSIDTLLGTPLSSNELWGGFDAWRRSGATGRYEFQQYNNWSWSFFDLDGTYNHDDLLLGSWWDMSDGKIFQELFPNGDDISAGWSYEIDEPSRNSLGGDLNFFKGQTSPILNIIEMNRFMNQFKRYFPRKEWTNSPGISTAALFACDSFLTDIKSSKRGCIEFSGEVPFNINLADGGISCIKKDIVKYRLYLYDDSKVRRTDKVAVLKDPKIGGYKRDTLGRPYRDTVDGEVIDANTANPSDQSIGELDKRWNPYTMKWESGSQNVFAKVVTHINAAVNNPSVESLEDSDIKADLDGDEDRHFAPSSGLVMPIEVQNKNPMQWQPNYARTSGCRDQEKEKATVIGFNYNPLKSYPRDSLVMLTKMGGIWHITDMGSGISPEDKPVEAIFEGKWQFQYLATNSNSFFTGYRDPTKPKSTRLTKIDPEEAEAEFHRAYYWDDVMNGGNDLENDYNEYRDLDAPIEDGEPPIKWTKKGIKRFFSVNGYWQFTSFDFMDERIGGTHNGNYIASTNCLTDSAGRSTDPGPEQNGAGGASTGGFFGCVFPEGYTLNTSSQLFGERSFVMGGATQGALYEPYFGTATYFNTIDLYNDINIQPFLDPAPDYRNEDPATGRWDGKYTPERSRQRGILCNGCDPNEDFDWGAESDNEPRYQATSPRYAPSMFFQETHNNKRDLKHLPADIGTLSSPSGRHGCPIQNIHALDCIHSLKFGDELQDLTKNVFKERYWIRRVDPAGTAVNELQYGPLDAGFGFKPKQTNKIMFRPLKAGTYAQFHPEVKNYIGWRGMRSRGMARGEWSAEVTREFHGDGGSIASPDSKQRELNQLSLYSVRAGLNGPYNADKMIWDDSVGLLLRGDIASQDQLGIGRLFGFGGSRHFYSPGYNGRVHDTMFMNKENFQDGLFRDDRGANAFGVIGAVATTAANNQIQFQTQNTLGMWCESQRSIGNSFLKPAWGGSDTSYNTNRTTELHATIYHAHPRSQTIYDPRFFAVHHFNPGMLEVKLPGSIKVPFQQRQGQNVVEIVNFIMTREVLKDDNGNEIQDDNGFFSIDRANRKFDWEFTEPTRYGMDGGAAITCETGDVVFKDSVFFPGGAGAKSSMHLESNWNFNSIRKGKLLPFRYYRNVLQAPWILNHKYDIGDPGSPVTYSAALPADGSVTAIDLVDQMVVISRGEGYKRGDILGNNGLGVKFSVESVEDYVDEDGNTIKGGIKEIKPYDLGNIVVSDISDSSRKMLPKKVSGYTIKTIAGAGNGFSAFFVNAKVQLKEFIDHKPGVVDSNGRNFRLSSAPDGGGSSSATNTRQDPIFDLSGIAGLFGLMGGGGSVTTNRVGRDFGIVYGGVDVSVIISPEQRSPDRKYDIFFHFHNDISHTWLNPEYGDVQNPMDVNENHITTQITAF